MVSVACRVVFVFTLIFDFATSLSMQKSSAAIRVVSYNVLSSHLASPSHYSTLNPEHLCSETRLTKVFSKLEHEIGVAKDRSTIFCLQEISYDWAGDFHTFFASRGYHVVTGLYGKPFDGYMGVLTAWPVDKLATVDVDISRLSDTVQWPPQAEESFISKAVRKLTSPLKSIGILLREPESHWSIAKRRFNVLLTAVLKDKVSKQTICVGNYHMPCCYYAPMVMTMHADMCVAHVQEKAAGNPYVIAGDFNFKPTESVYKMLTTGGIDFSDPFYPTPFDEDHLWQPKLKEKVRSAYAVANGSEPDFTNFARVKEEDPFIDTLDYIFVSDSVKVVDVLDLPNRLAAEGPFPNKDEPSDHVLVATNLDIEPAD